MDLSAMVVAKVGSKIVKVQCKTCKKEHGFKAPKGVKDPTVAPPPKAKKSAGGEKATTPPVSVQAEWERLMKDAAAAKRVKYSPKAVLTLGDVVQHPTFGDGIVTRVQHPDKAEIIFKTDLKLLIHSR
jgi:hypothetical protein